MKGKALSLWGGFRLFASLVVFARGVCWAEIGHLVVEYQRCPARMGFHQGQFDDEYRCGEQSNLRLCIIDETANVWWD